MTDNAWCVARMKKLVILHHKETADKKDKNIERILCCIYGTSLSRRNIITSRWSIFQSCFEITHITIISNETMLQESKQLFAPDSLSHSMLLLSPWHNPKWFICGKKTPATQCCYVRRRPDVVLPCTQRHASMGQLGKGNTCEHVTCVSVYVRQLVMQTWLCLRAISWCVVGVWVGVKNTSEQRGGNVRSY